MLPEYHVPYPADLPPEHEFFGDDSEVTEEERARFHDWTKAASQARQAAAAETLARKKARETQIVEGAGFVFVLLFVYLFVNFEFSLNL